MRACVRVRQTNTSEQGLVSPHLPHPVSSSAFSLEGEQENASFVHALFFYCSVHSVTAVRLGCLENGMPRTACCLCLLFTGGKRFRFVFSINTRGIIFCFFCEMIFSLLLSVSIGRAGRVNRSGAAAASWPVCLFLCVDGASDCQQTLDLTHPIRMCRTSVLLVLSVFVLRMWCDLPALAYLS